MQNNKNYFIMKTLVFFFSYLFIGILSSTQSYAQAGVHNYLFNTYDYKAWQEFNGDTIAYLDYNFNQSYYFNNCTVEDVIKKTEIPFKSYLIGETLHQSMGWCILFVEPAEVIKEKIRQGEKIYGIYCSFPDNYNIDSSLESDRILYHKYKKFGSNEIFPITKKEKIPKLLMKQAIEWAQYQDLTINIEMYKVH